MIGFLACILAETPPDLDGAGFTNGQGDRDDTDWRNELIYQAWGQGAAKVAYERVA